jgi:multimeric flavodoxin WrbA
VGVRSRGVPRPGHGQFLTEDGGRVSSIEEDIDELAAPVGRIRVKVVAVQGSPHKGNTYERVERFREAMAALGDVEFEHVPLCDVEIAPCRGCFMCFIRGRDACPLDDDKAEIERKLAEADGVVFASPVYSMSVSYLLKGFVDRCAYTFHRPRYFDKYAVGLAVAGGIGLKEALDYIEMFSGSWGFQYVGGLRYADPPRGTNLPRFMPEKDRTEEVARRLHHLMRTKPPRRLSRNDHLFFHAMRTVYSRMEEYSPADYAYWKGKGWLEPGVRYFTEDARAGLLKSLYPRFVAWMMGRALDKQVPRSNAVDGAN